MNPDLLQLLYSGGPAVMALGIVLVAVKKDLGFLSKQVAGIMATHVTCKGNQDECLDKVHERITAVQDRVATLEGAGGVRRHAAK